MNIRSKYIFLLSLIFLFCACSKESTDFTYNNNGNIDWESMPIVFSEPFKAEVKAAELKNDNLTSFGVYAALAVNNRDFQQGGQIGQLQNFMTNVPIQKEGTIWRATPAHYWPNLDDKSLSFFAYAPHNASGHQNNIVPQHDWSNMNVPFKIFCSPKSNPAEQVDLCVANAVFDRNKSHVDLFGQPLPVEFTFTHTLSWISFAANYVGTVPDGCYLRIDELVLYNVVESNTLQYVKTNSVTSSVNYEWRWDNIDINAPKVGYYTLSIGGNTLSSQGATGQRLPQVPLSGEATYYEFVNANGFIYAVPQEINPQGATTKTMMNITFSFVMDDNSADIVAQFYSNIELPTSTPQKPNKWEPARKIKYLFTIDVTTASLIEISAVDSGEWIEDWKPSGNNPDYDPTDNGENYKEII